MNIKSDKQMHRHMGILALLCSLFFCLSVRVYAENEYQITKLQMQGTLTTDSALNVRSGPGKEYDVIAKVKNDVMLEITGETDTGWYQVELNDQTGYVSGEYVSVKNADNATDNASEEREDTFGEPEEGYRGLNLSPQMKKAAAIGAVIVVVLVMLVITLKNMRREDEEDEEEYEDEDEGDEYDSDEEEDEDDEEEMDADDGREEDVQKQRREYIIREEDYRVQIDPSFFEDKEVIEQPDMVTGYLERILLEENQEGILQNSKESEENAEKQKELELAMEKLNELQKEIERLKNGN